MTQRTRKRSKAEAVSGETILTVRSSSFGREEEEREVLKVEKFESDPAYIRVAAGVTRNQGNYESLRVDVSISLPCYPEEVDEVFPLLADRVADYLDQEIDNYTKAD